MEKKIDYAVYGSFIGDFMGSHWEGLSEKVPSMSGDLVYFTDSSVTDDTKMTCAVASGLMRSKEIKPGFFRYRKIAKKVAAEMKRIGRKYPGRFGGSMWNWIISDSNRPYYSFGNGACMKLGPIGLMAKTREEAKKLAYSITSLTHNHPLSLYYANLVASLIFEAKTAKSMEELVTVAKEESDDALVKAILNMDLERLHSEYKFDITCQGSVPQALYCFFSSTSFEDCLRRCLYVGGDVDTIAACALSIAAPFYGDGQVETLVNCLDRFIPTDLADILKRFSQEQSK